MTTTGENNEYHKLMNKLAKRLKIRPHRDSSLTAQAAKILIEDIISDDNSKFMAYDSDDELNEDSIGCSIQTSKFDVADIPLPKFLSGKCDSMNSEDQTRADTLGRSARCLKLLYLEDQRQLQNQVNQAISSIQSLTADPKTDMKQMALGR